MEQLLKATLAEIEYQMERLYWNRYQSEMQSPFQNTGTEYSNDTFRATAYRWDDDEEKDTSNFVYKDLKVWWYKHFRRGMEWVYNGERHGIIPSEFLTEMLEECIKSMEIDFNPHKGKN